MSDTAIRMQNPSVGYMVGSRTNWSAIWAGVFTFAAIWSVFETLALAVFPGNLNAGLSPTVGMQIWTVILTIIAMYVAGIETGRLSGVATRHDGLIHGIVMFGLSVVSAIVLTAFANVVLAGGTLVHNGHILGLGAGTEWATFFTLFLGWLAAMAGASTGVMRRVVEVREPIQMRPAA
jgi:hypothetical protein